MTQAYPLQWPQGWPRFKGWRTAAKFGTAKNNDVLDRSKRRLSINDAMRRLASELESLGVRNARDDSVVSTNLRLNMSGQPRGDQGEPTDPGVAVYWQKPGQPMRVMAIDRYNRVADNIAAVAATLNAMRAIERHGGAQILERAFTGFDALPPPQSAITPPASWWSVLGVSADATANAIEAAYRAKAKTAHPDAGGSNDAMAALNAARAAGLKARGA